MGHFNKHDLTRNECMLRGGFAKKGYDWWWHSFTGKNANTGEEKVFFIEYFLCNPLIAKDEPTFRKNPKPSYMMVKAGCWGKNAKQLHRFFAWKDVKVYPIAPFAVKADDCYCSDFKLRGSIDNSKDTIKNHPEYMSDAGSMSWDLKIYKDIAYNVGYGAGKIFRTIQAFEMYWHAEGMKSYYEGTINLDGEDYIIEKETSYGYADKNWGRNFTSPWVWLSSNDLYSNINHRKLENSVFDIGGGRPKVFFVPLEKKLLGGFYYEGQEFEFNFSKFWEGDKTRFKCFETEDYIVWNIIQENNTHIIKTKVRCRKDEMLLVNYESPDGCKRHNRLWNGGTGEGRIQIFEKDKNSNFLIQIDDITCKHVGCEYGKYDK